MQFINLGEPIKVRQGEPGKYWWITLRKGETIDLTKRVGLNHKLKKMKETIGKVGKKIVETKQFEENFSSDGLFLKELQKIKGIGKKTASDVVTWGTREKLIETIKKREKIPFRDDVEGLLYKRYGDE